MKDFKKLLVLIVFLVFSFYSFAQEHTKFKNIPLKGTISEFSTELVKIGFVYKRTQGNIIMLSGTFIDKTCDILLIGTPKSKIIWKVVVWYPAGTAWPSLKRDYLELKEQLSKKYGKGESYEFFSLPYREGDGFEILALNKEKCTYSSFWTSELGNISLKIDYDARICLNYEDKENTRILDKEKQEVISKDL